MEGVAFRCVKTGYFFEAVSDHPSDDLFWTVVQNSLGESFCLCWCHLFGSTSDDLHLSRVFAYPDIVGLGTDYQERTFRSRIYTQAGISEVGFEELWKEVRRCRNKYIAHREVETNVKFPRTDICLKTVEALRTELAHCVTVLRENHPDNINLDSLDRFYKSNGNSFLRDSAKRQVIAGLKTGAGWAADLIAQIYSAQSMGSRHNIGSR
jgi:hypothetical protein